MNHYYSPSQNAEPIPRFSIRNLFDIKSIIISSCTQFEVKFNRLLIRRTYTYVAEVKKNETKK